MCQRQNRNFLLTWFPGFDKSSDILPRPGRGAPNFSRIIVALEVGAMGKNESPARGSCSSSKARAEALVWMSPTGRETRSACFVNARAPMSVSSLRGGSDVWLLDVVWSRRLANESAEKTATRGSIVALVSTPTSQSSPTASAAPGSGPVLRRPRSRQSKAKFLADRCSLGLSHPKGRSPRGVHASRAIRNHALVPAGTASTRGFITRWYFWLGNVASPLGRR
jgi:hypothetical protein